MGTRIVVAYGKYLRAHSIILRRKYDGMRSARRAARCYIYRQMKQWQQLWLSRLPCAHPSQPRRSYLCAIYRGEVLIVLTMAREDLDINDDLRARTTRQRNGVDRAASPLLIAVRRRLAARRKSCGMRLK